MLVNPHFKLGENHLAKYRSDCIFNFAHVEGKAFLIIGCRLNQFFEQEHLAKNTGHFGGG